MDGNFVTHRENDLLPPSTHRDIRSEDATGAMLKRVLSTECPFEVIVFITQR